jgi:uncharacterized membrane protein YedE/YeeE
VYVPETWILPQLAGGIVFGLGFAMAGLCPGTSCVSAATGRIDGLAVVVGMFAGVLGTGLLFRSLQSFYDSTPRGAFTLSELFSVSEGVVVFVVVAIAIGGFKVAEVLERRSEARIPQ